MLAVLRRAVPRSLGPNRRILAPPITKGQRVTMAKKAFPQRSAFTRWIRWADRLQLSDLSYPGVYVLAISRKDISGKAFSWIPQIAYVGMTNSKGGLRSRLRQFERTIKGGSGHGGARRVRFKHTRYATLNRKLYLAVRPFTCDVSSGQPRDLRIMGDVARFEYVCFARYSRRFGRLPEFNDKKRSPKK